MTAIANLQGDSFHDTFLIFVPGGRSLEYQWIDRWMYEKFGTMARELGPKSVLVAPPEGEAYADFNDKLGPERRLGWVPQGVGAVNMLHRGYPFLMITGSPGSMTSADGTSSFDGFVVNLAAFRDGSQLARFFDGLIRGSRERHSVDRLAELVPNTNVGAVRFLAEEGFEIKPNFFGVGVNVNAIAGWWNNRRETKLARVRPE